MAYTMHDFPDRNRVQNQIREKKKSPQVCFLRPNRTYNRRGFSPLPKTPPRDLIPVNRYQRPNSRHHAEDSFMEREGRREEEGRITCHVRAKRGEVSGVLGGMMS